MKNDKPIWETEDPQPWCRCMKFPLEFDDHCNYWCRKCQNWFIQPVPATELIK